jgi:hypothetical protein
MKTTADPADRTKRQAERIAEQHGQTDRAWRRFQRRWARPAIIAAPQYAADTAQEVMAL